MQASNIFKYIKTHNKRLWLVFDLISYDVAWVPFSDEARSMESVIALQDMYDISETGKLRNISEARGKAVDINIFVDSDHAGNQETRRSRTGIIICLNMAPIFFTPRSNRQLNHQHKVHNVLH